MLHCLSIKAKCFATIKSSQFLSLGSRLCLQACNIIKQSYQSKKIVQYKGHITDDDQVTQTDFKVQSMLEKGFRAVYPHIKIIGEESIDCKQSKNFNFKQPYAKNETQEALNGLKDEFEEEEACVWIDPIDCTKGFIHGYPEDVTTLVGVSIKNQAHLGIIASPFKKKGKKLFSNPSVVIASVSDRKAYRYDSKLSLWKTMVKKPIHSPIVIATSKTRKTILQQDYLCYMEAEKKESGGSGRKIMIVAQGQSDALVYLDAFTHKWDTCAGEAVIKSMGGFFTNSLGEKINYDPNESTLNRKGIFCTLHEHIYLKSVLFAAKHFQ